MRHAVRTVSWQVGVTWNRWGLRFLRLTGNGDGWTRREWRIGPLYIGLSTARD